MKVLIIGAGRMGIRHAQGLIGIKELTLIAIVDISNTALENARAALNQPVFEFLLLNEIQKDASRLFDICIIAATAGDRIALLKMVRDLKCKHILIEKPLGQSYEEVEAINRFVLSNSLDCVVNLNMRLYDGFKKLKNDIAEIPQLQGEKTISVNTGTIGIGGNGIHYLDLLFFILDADIAVLASGEIDDVLIPSGRGPQFRDFGGWALVKFFKKAEYIGKAFLSLSSSSTVFGSWEIVASHGRIYLNEVEQKRIDTLRKADSQMPVNRYFADYLPPVEQAFTSPFLGDLTALWVKELINGENILPAIEDSLKAHKLMFDWLSMSSSFTKHFPIT